MPQFDLVLSRTQYPTLSPRVAPLVPARPPILPVVAGTNQIQLAANAILNSTLKKQSAVARVSACPPITGATLQQINLGNPPASWLEGAGGVATTWGLVSLAGLAVAATGGAAIPAAALLKAGGAIAIGTAASVGASALRQATLESASRRVELSGAKQVQLVPLGDSICIYTFPSPDPAQGSSASGAGSILFAAAVQESSQTLRVITLLPDSVDEEDSVSARWGDLVVNLSPGQLVPQLSARQWSGIAGLTQNFDPPSLLVELTINGKFSGATTVAYLAEPPENAEVSSLELVSYRQQLIWSPRQIRGFRKQLTLPSGSELVIPPKPPILQDGNWRLTAIWRSPGLSFKSQLFASEGAARALRSYLMGSWPIPPTDVQLTETGRAPNQQSDNAAFEPIRGRYWNGERWIRYYWPS